jgi:hypothetical protein
MNTDGGVNRLGYALAVLLAVDLLNYIDRPHATRTA